MKINQQDVATLKGLALQIIDLDLTHPHAWEQAVSIGNEIERSAGKVVADFDMERSPLNPIFADICQRHGLSA